MKDYTKIFDLTGRVAIVTGGTGGFGHEVAIGLAQFGADVVVTARTLESLKQVAEEVRQTGRKALAPLMRCGRPCKREGHGEEDRGRIREGRHSGDGGRDRPERACGRFQYRELAEGDGCQCQRDIPLLPGGRQGDDQTGQGERSLPSHPSAASSVIRQATPPMERARARSIS